jgi:hypothetical protein
VSQQLKEALRRTLCYKIYLQRNEVRECGEGMRLYSARTENALYTKKFYHDNEKTLRCAFKLKASLAITI